MCARAHRAKRDLSCRGGLSCDGGVSIVMNLCEFCYVLGERYINIVLCIDLQYH
jgi:hypothetical protein